MFLLLLKVSVVKLLEPFQINNAKSKNIDGQKLKIFLDPSVSDLINCNKSPISFKFIPKYIVPLKRKAKKKFSGWPRQKLAITVRIKLF